MTAGELIHRIAGLGVERGVAVWFGKTRGTRLGKDKKEVRDLLDPEHVSRVSAL